MTLIKLLIMLINIIIPIMSAMLAMAFYTLAERKFLGYSQFRKGPNKPSIMGLLVPISDAGKLFTKEDKNNSLSNMLTYNAAPMTMIILSLMLWPLYPHFSSPLMLKYGLFYFLCVTSMSVYATFLAGWSSSSKWSMLGAIRSIAQTISYEVSMSLIMICFIMYYFSMNTQKLMSSNYSWIMFMLMPMVLMWMLSITAETHRAPFDFAEGESELVSGFNIEYKSSPFAMIFMAEYMNIILMSMITAILISTSVSTWEMLFKILMISFIFIWTRTTFPRLRYDILMDILWKKILPVTLLYTMTVLSMICFIS